MGIIPFFFSFSAGGMPPDLRRPLQHFLFLSRGRFSPLEVAANDLGPVSSVRRVSLLRSSPFFSQLSRTAPVSNCGYLEAFFPSSVTVSCDLGKIFSIDGRGTFFFFSAILLILFATDSSGCSSPIWCSFRF